MQVRACGDVSRDSQESDFQLPIFRLADGLAYMERKMEEPIQAFDWGRMFLGDGPLLFFLEILFRTAVIYVYTLFLLRWLGSRTVGQFSNLEFLLVIALGSAVGDAMFYADVPLLHSMAVITLVVLANKGLDVLMARNRQVERALDGVPQEAVRRGVIPTPFLKCNTMSTLELFQQLRQEGVEHLGQVEHAYLETDGILTVFKSNDQTRPGLPIVPPWELEAPPEAVPSRHSPGKVLACLQCGYLRAGGDSTAECENCGHDKWTPTRI